MLSQSSLVCSRDFSFSASQCQCFNYLQSSLIIINRKRLLTIIILRLFLWKATHFMCDPDIPHVPFTNRFYYQVKHKSKLMTGWGDKLVQMFVMGNYREHRNYFTSLFVIFLLLPSREIIQRISWLWVKILINYYFTIVVNETKTMIY